MKHAALNLYSFYYKNRHTTFHMDQTTETSRILDYSTACDVVKEGLGLISRLPNTTKDYFCCSTALLIKGISLL